MALPDLSLRRPVATAMTLLAVAMLGVVSFARLPVNLLPDVAFPTLAVWTEYPDAGPAEVERFVTRDLEETLSRAPGVLEVSSSSREGQSLVRLRFAWGTDMEFAALDVREKLENARAGLPEAAGRPTILRTDPSSEPIMTLAVTGADPLELANLSEAVFKRRLEQLDGVALAAVTGGPRREIHVTVNPELLATYGVRIDQVTAALDRANYSAPGGQIRRGRFYYSLRTQGEFQELADVRQVVVARPSESGDGGAVRLGDVADVTRGMAERTSLARYGGEPAVGLQIYKESAGNTVRVAERVEEALGQLRAEFSGLELSVARSQAEFIRNAISGVAQALILGGLLAFLVLFLFLRDPRYPVAVGLSIPISVLAAFGLLYLFDVSLNVMSLGGLALGVGMLVDNSIVVLENVFRHRDEEGRAPVEASAVGAREVTAAITASTLTTIAVFGPVLYVEGVAGALFRDLSLAVAFSLAASLGVALTLLPVVAARLAGALGGGGADGGPSGGGRPRGEMPDTRGPEGGMSHGRGSPDAPPEPPAGSGSPDGWPGRALSTARGLGRRARRWLRAARDRARRSVGYVAESVRLTARDVGGALSAAGSRLFGPFLRAFDRRFRRFTVRYEEALEWALDHRGTVVLLAAGSLVVAGLLVAALPQSLMPRVDEGQFRVDLELPAGTPLSVTDDAAGRIEDLLLETDGVEAVFARVGRAGGDGAAAAAELTGLNQASLEVRLAPGADPAHEVAADLRERLPGSGVDPRHVTVRTGRATSLGQALALTDADLAVSVQGEDLDRLFAVADSARERLAATGALADVRVDIQRTQPILEVEVLREQVARHDLTVNEVADAIEAYLRGERTDRPFTEFAEQVDIRVRLPASERQELSEVLSLTVGGVPVEQLVEVRRTYGPVEIRRQAQARTVRVLASSRGAGLEEAVDEAQTALAGLDVPSLVSVQVGGANEQMRESFRSLLFAFGLALFLVYLILSAQFESLRQPFVILAAVPLAAVGAVLALAAAGDGVNVMSGIGVLVLVGIVVNDAIIKVDFINQRRDEGLGLREALVEAGRLRLRPILMTTVTTVFGLLPMALGWGAGADLRSPLAVAVIGGLISATVLTLVVVPVIYSLVAARGESL